VVAPKRAPAPRPATAPAAAKRTPPARAPAGAASPSSSGAAPKPKAKPASPPRPAAEPSSSGLLRSFVSELSTTALRGVRFSGGSRSVLGANDASCTPGPGAYAVALLKPNNARSFGPPPPKDLPQRPSTAPTKARHARARRTRSCAGPKHSRRLTPSRAPRSAPVEQAQWRRSGAKFTTAPRGGRGSALKETAADQPGPACYALPNALLPSPSQSSRTFAFGIRRQTSVAEACAKAAAMPGPGSYSLALRRNLNAVPFHAGAGRDGPVPLTPCSAAR
jgi:hypothetical protein